MDYNEMLDRAYLLIPKEALNHERFVIPSCESMIQGKKTFVKNISSLIKDMRRDENHFMKFLMKETGLPVTKNGNQIIISGKVGAIQLNKIIENYFSQFILCSVCKKPDTKILTEGSSKIMKCEACGAVTPIKNIR
jgi:translation initiation factor 2 subunit 2